MSKGKIALIENFGLDFCNFRIPLANFLEKEGYEVFALVPDDGYSQKIEESGIKTFNYCLKKNSLNPFLFFNAIKKFRRYNKEINFSIVHSFRLQPNILTNFSFGFSRTVKIVNHVTGLGYAFTNKTIKSLIYRMMIIFLYQIIFLFSDKIIVQNMSDFKILSRLLFISHKLNLIEGSGIDEDKFNRKSVNKGNVTELMNSLSIDPSDTIVTFTGRLLIEKGIMEFLYMANKVIKEREGIKFLVAGWFDENNPTCANMDIFNSLLDEKRILYLGMISDIRELLYITDIFILPTYREGFPRSILEAMSMEVAVITTDVPGAKDTVIDNYNGLIVPHMNIDKLKMAFETLLINKDLRAKFGQNGRMLIEKKYKERLIFFHITSLYNQLLIRC